MHPRCARDFVSPFFVVVVVFVWFGSHPESFPRDSANFQFSDIPYDSKAMMIPEEGDSQKSCNFISLPVSFNENNITTASGN